MAALLKRPAGRYNTYRPLYRRPMYRLSGLWAAVDNPRDRSLAILVTHQAALKPLKVTKVAIPATFNQAAYRPLYSCSLKPAIVRALFYLPKTVFNQGGIMPRTMCRSCHRLTVSPAAPHCGWCSGAVRARRGPKTRRERPGRPSAHKRGYDAVWRRNSKLAISQQPFCTWCLTAGSIPNPLTGDHITPISKGGSNERSNIRVLCRRCNSRRGNKVD